MDTLYTFGKSVFNVCFPHGQNFTMSVISRRARRLIVKKNSDRKWGKRIYSFFPDIYIDDYVIFAFCPETGFHLACKELG